MSVGDTLRKLREQHGLTQEQFADKIGVKRTTYISYETSKTNPGFVLIRKIADIFDVSILDFMEDEPPKQFDVLRSPEVIYHPEIKRGDLLLTSEEKFIVDYYRSLNGEEREIFLSRLKDDFFDKRCGSSDE